MASQLSKKAALPLAKILATCRNNVSNTGPRFYNKSLLSAQHVSLSPMHRYFVDDKNPCGRYSLSVLCHINVLCYWHRLLTMPGEKIVKSVFHTLNALNGQGFSTWVTKAYWLKFMISIWMRLTAKQFKSLCSERTKYVFVENWHTDLHDKPLLKSYRLFKNEFSCECYLDYIKVSKFRIPL